MFLGRTLPTFVLMVMLPAPSWPAALTLDEMAKNPTHLLQTAQNKNVVSSKSAASSLEQASSRGQLDKARKLLSQLLKFPKVDSDTLMRTGIQLAQLELYSEATLVFTRCAKDYPAVFEGALSPRTRLPCLAKIS